MKVIIKADHDLQEDNIDLIFTDEHLDNDNFIDMVIGDKSYTLSLDDLMSVFIAFDSQRGRRIARDKEYSD